MKKLFLFLTFTLLLFQSFTIEASAQTFTCNCITTPSGGCIWEPAADASCPAGYGATAAACEASTNIECLSDASTCTANCVQNPIPYAYGSNCMPGNPRVDCQPDSRNTAAPVSCRFSPEINYGRCLKNQNALSSGTPCRDTTECAGSSEGSLCAFLPGVATQRACITQVEMDAQGLDCDLNDSNIPICDRSFINEETAPKPESALPKPNCKTSDGLDGANTALGCIPFNTLFLTARGNAFLLGIAGSIALILIARAAFMVMTSRGDPARLSEAKDAITGAVTGLVMLIFAMFILRFIGDTLLGLF